MCAKFHRNCLKTVTSRPELTDRHPTKELIPYLVEMEPSLAQSIKVNKNKSLPLIYRSTHGHIPSPDNFHQVPNVELGTCIELE